MLTDDSSGGAVRRSACSPADLPAAGLRDRNVLILGLGILNGGIGTAQYCARHGARLRITDLRSREQLAPALAALREVPAEYVLGEHRAEDVHWADLIFRNPGVPPNHELLRLAGELGRPVEMELAYFARHCPAAVYAVTGTKGKTTTTTVLHQMLRAGGRPVSLTGNMGQAAMPLLDQLTATDEVVVEASSYQLEGLAGRGAPIRVAVITNIEDDHLDRYGSVDRYRQAKLAVAEGQGPDDWLLLPGWDVALAQACAGFAARKVYVRWPGQEPVAEAEFRPAAVVEIVAETERPEVRWRDETGETTLADLTGLRLGGAHNRINVAFAAAAAYAAGRSPELISRCVPELEPVPHRLEVVAEVSGVTFVNDSAASAPLAVVAALAAWEGRRVVLIAGGQEKGSDYAVMADQIRAAGARLVLLPGTATERLVKELRVRGFAVPEPVGSMRQAVESAWRLARAEPVAEVVLLSPGAASFGLFLNEFDRGEQFRAAVADLPR